jgi:hypothetical protein
MSTRDDAVLTDAEREAFARLQAQVVGHDRPFGPLRSWRLGARLHAGGTSVGHLAARAWFGPLVVVAGVIAVAAGLVWGVAIAVVGLVAVTAGAVPIVHRLRVAVDKALANRTTT